MLKLFSKFLDSNEKQINKLRPVIEKINALEEKIQKLSNEELRKKTEEFRKKIGSDDQIIGESDNQKNKSGHPIIQSSDHLDAILPEAFAVVREAARRTIGERPYDVQVMAAIVLHQGKIAEQKTGEGKTLSATMPLYLNALTARGVHLVTVNDYLTRRDTEWMGPIYHLLGLTVGCINHEKSYLYQPPNQKFKVQSSKLKADEASLLGKGEFLREVPRKEAYAADITYGTNNEFGFDYLRDNMVGSLNQMVQTNFQTEFGVHHFAIVDEVDFLLIDEARTPLIISAPAEESNELYIKFANFVPTLPAEYFEIDEKGKTVHLTELGLAKMEKMLNVENLYENFTLVHHLEQAVKAYKLFSKDRDYIVKDNQVTIVDEFTGRLMPGRRYSEGLHQAIEAKEKVPIQKESKTLATITFQNYFRMYEKLAGMTGTAATEAEEFNKIYDLDVMVIPTHKPLIRVDHPDKVYKNQRAKFKAVIDEIEESYQRGQPVLLGTTSVEKNELVSKLLKRRNIPHEVLNAKNHQKEAEIIAKAGAMKAITVATNLAGRGTDIKLEENTKKLGGLRVIGTERHEARRIDNQLRGRSGRQGDAGESTFYIALDDDLMRIFGGEKIASLMTRFNLPEDIPIEAGLVSKAIENAQVKVEGFNFDIRKHLVEYDDVINKQREIIYTRRKKLLEKVEQSSSRETEQPNNQTTEQSSNRETGEIREQILEKIRQYSKNPDEAIKEYEKREKEYGPNLMQQIIRIVSLQTIDSLWMEHIDALDELRVGIGLRSFGQRDPLIEFKNEGYNMFESLIGTIDSEIINRILKIQIVAQPSITTPEKINYHPSKAGSASLISRASSPEPVEWGFRASKIKTRHEETSAFSQSTSQKTQTLPTELNNRGAEELRNKATEQQSDKAKRQPYVKSQKVGRNDPCPCGKTSPMTGEPMKYKKCCWPKFG